MVRQQAQPYIDQYGPKYKLDAIEFESLTLGTLPPTFVGIKIFHLFFCPYVSFVSRLSFAHSGSGKVAETTLFHSVYSPFDSSGMKVYDTKEKEMILEPSFKFAGNPNIIVAVKAFGMKATVQVS